MLAVAAAPTDCLAEAVAAKAICSKALGAEFLPLCAAHGLAHLMLDLHNRVELLRPTRVLLLCAPSRCTKHTVNFRHFQITDLLLASHARLRDPELCVATPLQVVKHFFFGTVLHFVVHKLKGFAGTRLILGAGVSHGHAAGFASFHVLLVL